MINLIYLNLCTMKYLLVYSSRFGYTLKIAQTLEAQWTTAGITVDMINLADDPFIQQGNMIKSSLVPLSATDTTLLSWHPG